MAAVGDGNLREFSVSTRQREREGETRERDGEEREGGQERGRGSLAWRLGIETISMWRLGRHGAVGAQGRRARAREELGFAGR